MCLVHTGDYVESDDDKDESRKHFIYKNDILAATDAFRKSSPVFHHIC